MYGELLHVASLQGLTGKEHFRSRPIHWIIDLTENGEPLAFSPTVSTDGSRGKKFHCAKNYHMQFKGGKLQGVCTNQSNWLPDFLVGPVDEIFPRGADGKSLVAFNKRRETWRLIQSAARDLPDNKIIQGLKRFLITRTNFLSIYGLCDGGKHSDSIFKLLKEGKENIAFRVAGRIASFDQELLEWWRQRVMRQREDVCQRLPIGSDLLSDSSGPLSEYYPSVLGGTPMISYNKAPFQSFGMGSQTTPMLLENAERCAAALNSLCEDSDSTLWLGGLQAVFWVANDQKCVAPGFGRLIEVEDPISVRDFLGSPWGGISKVLPAAKFHAVVLKKTKGRFSIRHWHETSISVAESNMLRWFGILDSVSKAFMNSFAPCGISDLARCTIQKSKNSKPGPRTYTELFDAALFGKPLPSRLFSAALQRQALELVKGCDKTTRNEFEERLRGRTALIKLYFELNNRGGEKVTMENHTSQNDSAYLCGRLLALLDKIHVDAHKGSGGTNSSPANRAYSAASTTPGLIFPQLCKLARYHLNKVEPPRWAFCLEHGYEAETGVQVEGLKQVVARLQDAAGGNFPKILSLEQQGRFAIGFYYERCRKWPPARKKESTIVDDKHN
ncbi:MAG: type I-C CRISPR-associated protein Cas8c/Csd1 [Thermodesulfobacteriota bacterium]